MASRAGRNFSISLSEDVYMLRDSILLGAAAVLLGAVAWHPARAATGADASAGKAIVHKTCGACHDRMMAMWKGKSASEIDGLIHQVVAGKVPHPKKLGLTSAQMADVAAYWASVAN
jgi:mono/diheme cytochrome c family protein